MSTTSSSLASAGSNAHRSRVFTSKQLAFEKIRSLALDGTVAERMARLATALIMALGIWLRSRGYLFSTIPMWLDECSWTILLLTRPLSEHLIRPIGFMALTKALAHVFSPTESVMRFLPWAAGVTTVLMAPVLGSKLFRSTAPRLLFVSILALDPTAIDLSKEFKPYAIGLALHVALVLSTIRYCWSARTRDLVYALALISISVLFAQDAMFAYPGLFLVIALETIRGRRFKHFVAAAGTALVTAAVVAGLYIFIWSKLDHSKEEKYWGKKYDVFYVANKASHNKVDWAFGRYAALVEATGSRRELWESKRIEPGAIARLVSLDGVLWLVLHVAGLVVIVRARKGREALLLVLPLGVMAAFNWFGFWPQGPFRTNLFTLAYSASIASFAFESERRMARIFDLAPAALFVFLPLFVFEKTWHREKEMRSMTDPATMPDALQELIRQQGSRYSGPREKLLMDGYGCDPYEYYTKYHPTWSKRLGSKLARRFEFTCAKGNAAKVIKTARQALKTHDRVWVLSNTEAVIKGLEKAWPADLERVQQARIGENHHLILGIEKKKAAEPPPVLEEPPSAEDSEPQIGP
jgi:hypothetical protein